MLKKISPAGGQGGRAGQDGLFSINDERASVPVCRASYPVPFAQELEFNAPVHGTWNIVHIGMLVPECHQIYVCADNCMRGVVLTAAEMDAADRFSCVLLEEKDLYEGSLEDITIEGITDAINRLPYRPRAVAVFLVCLHHVVGTDAAWVYRTLEERFPDIDFMRCWMDPVMQKTGLTPEQKLKEAMFRPVRPLPAEPGMVFVLGDNQPLDPESDLARTITDAGCRVRTLYDCKSYEDYLQIGAASLLITRSPTGVHGVTQLAHRLDRPFLYLPPALGKEEINRELQELEKFLPPVKNQADPSSTPGFPEESATAGLAEKALRRARALIGDTEVTIDYIATPRPLGLARLLLEHDFHVTRVYLDAVSPEEREDFDWLASRHPDLMLTATIRPEMRVLHAAENEGKMLAIGPKAAWFGGTAHFVNTVEYSGMWGFSGIEKLAGLMEDAFLHEKDTRAIVPLKGFGCRCVVGSC
ncbi:MAG: nitrogenase [Lachnospiraceae bacterium]|nr:nitrogenase [Lachnospiraceae bacterium]